MKRMLEHPQPYTVVTALAQAMMGLPLFSNRTIIIAFSAPMRRRGIGLLIEISQGLGLSYPRHFRDRIALLTTPHMLVAAVVPALRIDTALITKEGRPTSLPTWRAARAGDEPIVSAHIRPNGASPLCYSALARRGSDVGGWK